MDNKQNLARKKAKSSSSSAKKSIPTTAAAEDCKTVPTDTKSLNQTKNLSLIFSKLAEFEDLRSDEEFFKLTDEELVEIESCLKTSLAISPVLIKEQAYHHISDIYHTISDDGERQVHLSELFQGKNDLIAGYEKEIMGIIPTLRTQYKKKDSLILEKLKLLEEIELLESSYNEKADLCRSLQTKGKEYEVIAKELLEAEIKKTAELELSCFDSINSLSSKVDEEEMTVMNSEQDNETLTIKIDEFRKHLKIQESHIEAQNKAKVIEKQLLEAKQRQLEHTQVSVDIWFKFLTDRSYFYFYNHINTIFQPYSFSLQGTTIINFKRL